MKALSIRQPWAWMILHLGKNIENRKWRTSFRGRFLIHASSGMTRNEYDAACYFASLIVPKHYFHVPNRCDLPRGGIVGSVELVTCLTVTYNPWFSGPFGFYLKEPMEIPFRPWTGRLGFFDIPDGLILTDAPIQPRCEEMTLL